MKVVSNSTALIYAPKIGRIFDILRSRFEKIIIPEKVYEEVVVRGKELRISDVYLIEEQIKNGFIEILKLKDRTLYNKLAKELDAGEAQVIALALQEKIPNVMIDERIATAAARASGLKVYPLTSLIVLAYRDRTIDKKTAIDLLDELLATRYRLSADDYRKILRLVE